MLDEVLAIKAWGLANGDGILILPQYLIRLIAIEILPKIFQSWLKLRVMKENFIVFMFSALKINVTYVYDMSTVV